MHRRRPLSEGRPVEERVLEEWRQDELHYVSPANTLKRFGYMFDGVDIDYRAKCESRVLLQDEAIASVRRPFDGSGEATFFVQELARSLGADDVAIAAVDRRYVYDEAEMEHDYVVLLAVDMAFGEFVDAPDARCHTEVWRAYDLVGEIAVQVAAALRDRGYAGLAHTVKREGLALIPHAVAAGMGELGKHGSMIHPFLGPTFRLSAVTTDLELIAGNPVSFGMDEFCARCRLCVDFCPGDAITHDKVLVRNTERWVVDTEKCVPFMASHEACGVCLQVCPFNAKAHDGEFKQLFRETVRKRRPEELRSRLSQRMQEPWSIVSRSSD
jgi:ferredoxin